MLSLARAQAVGMLAAIGAPRFPMQPVGDHPLHNVVMLCR